MGPILVTASFVTSSRILTTLTCTAVCVAFSALLLFCGVETNLLFLAVGVTVIVGLALATMHLTPLSSSEALLVLLTTGVLLIAQLQSLSPESSFPVSWIIALVVAAYVLGRSLGQKMQTVWCSLTVVVSGIAAFFAWNLVAHDERPGLPLTDYNNYSSLLYVIVLPLTDFLLSSRRLGLRSPVHWLILFLVMIVVMLIAATGSRAGLWIVIAGVSVLVFVYGLLPERRGVALRVFVATFIGVLLFNVFLDRSDATLASAESIEGGVSVRWALIESALSMRLDNPLAGLGLLVFPLLYRQIRGSGDPDTAGLFVHNDYVQLLVETGPLLFLPLVLLVILVPKTLMKSWREVRRNEVPQVRLGYALALGGLLAHVVVNFVFYTAVLSLLAGFLAALVVTGLERDGGTGDKKVPRLLLVPSALVAVVALGYLWLDVASAAVFKGQTGTTWTEELTQSHERQLNFAWQIKELNPDRGTPHVVAAVLSTMRFAEAASQGAESRVLDAWRQALRADAWNTHAWWQFREFVVATPGIQPSLREDEQPDALLARMLSLDPIFVPAIDAVLLTLSSHPDAVRHQVEFLEKLLSDRMSWLSRENREAAIAYSRFLSANATSGERRAKWISTLQEVEAVAPLTEKKWFF